MADEGTAPTARDNAQGYYNYIAGSQAIPFTPTRLGGMKWVQPLYGIDTFKSRDEGFANWGQTWPDDDPRWIIMNRHPGNILNNMHRSILQGKYVPLRNEARAERWGQALFTLGHELGHNYTTPQFNFNEGSADFWSKSHFREYGRTLGLDRHQLNRMWRANSKFDYVKKAPQ